MWLCVVVCVFVGERVRERERGREREREHVNFGIPISCVKTRCIQVVLLLRGKLFETLRNFRKSESIHTHFLNCHTLNSNTRISHSNKKGDQVFLFPIDKRR